MVQSIVIRGGIVVDVIHPERTGVQDILIEDDRIVAVGTGLQTPPNSDVVDATDRIVIPGLVDTHRHTWQAQLRNVSVDLVLSQYFEQTIGRLAPRYRPEDVYAGNLAGAVECLDAGITTLFDWSHIQNTPQHTDAAIDALRESRIRAVFGYGFPNTDLGAWMWESSLLHPDDARRVKSQYFTSEGLLSMAMVTRGPEYSRMDVVEHDWALARELDCRLSLHIGGGEYGPLYQGITRMAERGLLGPDTNYVHCTTISDSEFDLIRDSGGSVSFTPGVEMQMGHGYPPFAAARRRGIPIGLGVDVVTNSGGDLFGVMRTAFSAWRYQDISAEQERGAQLGGTGGDSDVPELISSIDVLRAATIDGARAIGLGDEIGSLEPGKKADIVLLDASKRNLWPLHDPIGATVTAADTSNVDTVIVDGAVVKRAGALAGDLPRIRRLAEESAQYLLG